VVLDFEAPDASSAGKGRRQGQLNEEPIGAFWLPEAHVE
jgi:hypothetical protein